MEIRSQSWRRDDVWRLSYPENVSRSISNFRLGCRLPWIVQAGVCDNINFGPLSFLRPFPPKRVERRGIQCTPLISRTWYQATMSVREQMKRILKKWRFLINHGRGIPFSCCMRLEYCCCCCFRCDRCDRRVDSSSRRSRRGCSGNDYFYSITRVRTTRSTGTPAEIVFVVFYELITEIRK